MFAHRIMRNYFKLADKSNDERLDKNEISTFLDSINIRLKKNKLTDLVDVSSMTMYIYSFIA